MRSSLLILSLLAFAACDSGSPTDPGGSDSQAPARIVVVGPPIVLAADGSAGYRAFALAEDGSKTDVTDRAIWSSDDESVFRVDAGQITIHQPGMDYLRARIGGVEGKLLLSLRTRLSGTPLPAIEGDEHLPTIGQSTQLIAKMSFPGLSQVDVSDDVSWESSDPSVLAVDIHGMVTAVGNGEAYITARYGTTPGSLPIVAGPMPATTYDVSVIAIRLNADKFCENSDEGDAEFSYEFKVTTSTGDEFTIATTDDYPSSGDYDVMLDDAGTTGILKVDGEANFVLSEIQSFKISGRVTEWDHEFYNFGDWIPDPDGDDMADEATHRGNEVFDEGLHALRFGGSGGGCDLRFEYRIVVTER